MREKKLEPLEASDTLYEEIDDYILHTNWHDVASYYFY